jgi:serine/threonine protein kinase
MEVPQIVRRDLKPANVLWLDGGWKIADFDIAKFVEDVTSLNTVKAALTPPYAHLSNLSWSARTRSRMFTRCRALHM